MDSPRSITSPANHQRITPMNPIPPIPSSESHVDGDRQVFHISLANISYKDVNFIAGVISMFADPVFHQKAEDFRNGKFALLYSATGTPFEKAHPAHSIPLLPSVPSPHNN